MPKRIYPVPGPLEPAVDSLEGLPDAVPAVPVTPQDDGLDNLPDQPSPLSGAFDAVAHTQPDQAAKVMQLSKKVGEPEEYVAANLPEVEKAAASPSTSMFAQLERDYPGTTKWLSNPNNMAVGRDDIANISAHEDIFSRVKDAWQSEKNALKAGLLQEELGFTQYNKMLGGTTVEGDNFRLGSGQTQGYSQNLDERATQLRGELERLEAQRPTGALKRGIYGATEFIPQIVSAAGYGAKFGIPLAAGAEAAAWWLGPYATAPVGAAFATGMTVGGVDYNYRLMTGLQYEALSKVKDQQGNPLPEDVKKLASIATGAAASMLSMVKISALMDTVPGGKEFLQKFASSVPGAVLQNQATMSQALKRFATTWATSTAHGTGAMVGITATNLVGQEGAKLLSGQEHEYITPGQFAAELGHSAADAALTFGVMGLPGTSFGLARDTYHARKVEQVKEVWKAIGEQGESSKLRERMPEQYRNFISEVTKDGPIENVYMPAEAFMEHFQDAAPQVADELGVRGSFEEARATGGDVKIPLADWAEKVVGTEYFQKVIDDIKFDPEEPTARQYKEIKAQREAEMKAQIAEQERLQTEQGQVIAEGAKNLSDGLREQLVTAGLTKTEALAGATLHEEFWKNQATQLGAEPQALQAETLPLEVRAGENAPTKERVYEQSPENAPTFYHKLQRTIEEKLGNSASVEQVRGTIREMKPEEIKWSGIEDFLKGKEKVDKAELLDFLRANQLEVKEVEKRSGSVEEIQDDFQIIKEVDPEAPDYPDYVVKDWAGNFKERFNSEEAAENYIRSAAADGTKYSSYQLPGGDNYKELLFTLPTEKKGLGELREGESLVDALDRARESNPRYQSSHFDEPNVLAHTRFNERIDADGKRVLHIEEIQSDWHQEGRKKGYKEDVQPQISKLMAELKPLNEKISAGQKVSEAPYHANAVKNGLYTEAEAVRANELRKEISKLQDNTGKVPDAPLKKTWHEFVLKRMIRYAAENGFDKVTWTTGEQQADRYDIGKKISKVELMDLAPANGEGLELIAYDKNDNHVLKEKVSTPEEAEKFVGKEIAKKLFEGEYVENEQGMPVKTVEGLDLKVGGEGMKGFYDKMIPDFLNKFGKKYDAKVGEAEVESVPTSQQYADGAIGGEHPELSKVHSLELTPKLREAALKEGFSLFQKGPDDTRGRIRIGDQGAVIDLFKAKDKSTFLHESGHYFLEVMQKLSGSENAPETLKTDVQTIRDWLGAKEGERVSKEGHEKWARGFEAYLREGKAPTQALRSAFRRFKNWLMGVYKSAQQLNVELTPEIRDVMDRMFAAKEEVLRAEESVGMTEERMPGLSPEVADRITVLQERARESAENSLLKEQMKELDAQQKQKIEISRVHLTQDATTQVDNLPLYRAQKDIKEAVGGKTGPAGLANRFIEGKLKDEQAAHFEVAAEEHGFASGEELAQAIIQSDAMGGYQKEINARVEAGMQQYLPLKDSGALKTEALKAIHSNKMTELLALEHEILQGLVNDAEISTEVSKRRKIEAAISAKIAKEQAHQILAGKPLRDATSPRVYITAERTAALKVEKAMRAGDYEAAAQAKQQQMLNHALVSEALRNKAEAQKATKYLVEVSKRGADLLKMPYGFIRHVDKLLSQYGFAEARPEEIETLTKIADNMAAEGKGSQDIANMTGLLRGADGVWKQETLQDFSKRVTDDYYGLSVPEGMLNEIPKEFKDITLGELRDVKDLVKSISEIGKKYNHFIGSFEKLTLQEAALEFRKSVEATLGNKYAERSQIGFNSENKLGDAVQKFFDLPDGAIPQLVNVLTLCHVLDGGKETGPAKEYIYRPLKEAEDRKLVTEERVKQEVNDLLEKHYTPKELKKYSRDRFNIEEFGGRPMNREQILALLLNWGNEGNRDRIRRGYELSDQQVEAVFNKYLGERDFKFAQGVWDFIDGFWPRIAELEMAVTGVEPKKVDRTTVNSKYGSFDGGYYPIAYDSEKSTPALINFEQKNELYKTSPAAKAQTEKGHTIERVSTLKRPVNLTLNTFFNHVENVVHDLEMRKAIIDVNRFLNQGDTKVALEGAIGNRGYKMLGDWLKSVASDQGEYIGSGEKAAKWFRFSTTMASLTWKIANVPLDVAGNAITSVGQMGPKQFIGAVKDFAFNPKETKQFVDSASARMGRRSQLIERDVMDIARKFQGKNSLIAQYGFMFQSMADEAISYPVWMRTYQNALSEHGHETAVNIADETVARSFGSGSKLDQVGAQRGSEFKKLTTMFYSWNSMMFNRMWADGKLSGIEYSRGNTGAALAIIAKATFYGWAMQSLNENFWREALRNTDNDDPEARKKRMIGRTLAQPFGYVWLARDAAGYFIDKASGTKGAHYKLSPVESAAESLITPPAKMLSPFFGGEGPEFDQKFAEEVARSAAIMLKTPQKLNDLAFNYLDWLNGNGELTWRDFLNRKVKK